ncbi:SAF domain-containing protein [Microbacterium istanbulense]|uniref:SAF domain-containing protein n=1 Tax=Microbacterium istanbulense TaxID=3122049 RepID=A0ABU8LIJ9_9MICO
MMTRSRPRRAYFVDVRFIVGIVLVIASIAGVWALVAASRQTTPMLQATTTIVVGEALDSEDFQVVEVGLGTLTDDYLAPQDLEAGMVASRTLARGELVPTASVTDADSARTTTIVIPSAAAIPAGVKEGTVVELWQAPLKEDGRSFDTPRILVADAVVATVAESEGMLSQERTDVEVVIDRADVASVLEAMTGGAAISLVPTGDGS